MVDWNCGAAALLACTSVQCGRVVDAPPPLDRDTAVAEAGHCEGDVLFPDPALDAFIRSQAGVDSGPLDRAALARVTTLVVRGVARLDGVECLTSDLYAIDLGGGQIRDLTPLASVRLLGEKPDQSTGQHIVTLTGNPIDDIRPLSGLGIGKLFLDRTNVTDLAPLAGMSTLQHLDISETPVSTLDPLAQTKDLYSLVLRGTTVSSLAPLSALRNLEAVDARDCAISNLAPTMWQPLAAPKGTLQLEGNPLDQASTSTVLPSWCASARWCSITWATSSAPQECTQSCPPILQ